METYRFAVLTSFTWGVLLLTCTTLANETPIRMANLCFKIATVFLKRECLALSALKAYCWKLHVFGYVLCASVGEISVEAGRARCI